MKEPLPEGLRRLRTNWHADLQTVREALDRMNIPQPPDLTRSLDRTYPAEEPAPSLVWRLAWLEGSVAQLVQWTEHTPQMLAIASAARKLLRDEGDVADLESAVIAFYGDTK